MWMTKSRCLACSGLSAISLLRWMQKGGYSQAIQREHLQEQMRALHHCAHPQLLLHCCSTCCLHSKLSLFAAQQMFSLLVIKVFLYMIELHRSASKPPLGTPRKIGQGCRFHSFTTNTYKMHFLESPSGIKVGTQSSMAVCAVTKCNSKLSSCQYWPLQQQQLAVATASFLADYWLAKEH